MNRRNQGEGSGFLYSFNQKPPAKWSAPQKLDFVSNFWGALQFNLEVFLFNSHLRGSVPKVMKFGQENIISKQWQIQ